MEIAFFRHVFFESYVGLITVPARKRTVDCLTYECMYDGSKRPIPYSSCIELPEMYFMVHFSKLQSGKYDYIILRICRKSDYHVPIIPHSSDGFVCLNPFRARHYDPVDLCHSVVDYFWKSTFEGSLFNPIQFVKSLAADTYPSVFYKRCNL